MKAIILAAGAGSRLRPFTNRIPKTLVTVRGKAILGYLLDALLINNITEVVLCMDIFLSRLGSLHGPILILTFGLLKTRTIRVRITCTHYTLLVRI